MRIEDFPRPPDDNGRGVHWSARLYHDVITPTWTTGSTSWSP
jgi:hypothetical protein